MNFDPRLYLVLDPTLARGRDVAELIERALDGGVTLVQVREKGCSNDEFTALASQAAAVLKKRRVPLIVNDRADVALAIGAEGLHIGQSDMHWSRARELLGPNAILGLSIENLTQAHDAETADVDYLGVSAVFATASKPDVRTLWGLEGLRELRRRSNHCLVGIGGIDVDNARQTLAHGADGLAVVSAICSADDPCAEAARLRRVIDAHFQPQESL